MAYKYMHRLHSTLTLLRPGDDTPLTWRSFSLNLVVTPFPPISLWCKLYREFLLAAGSPVPVAELPMRHSSQLLCTPLGSPTCSLHTVTILPCLSPSPHSRTISTFGESTSAFWPLPRLPTSAALSIV